MPELAHDSTPPQSSKANSKAISLFWFGLKHYGRVGVFLVAIANKRLGGRLNTLKSTL